MRDEVDCTTCMSVGKRYAADPDSSGAAPGNSRKFHPGNDQPVLGFEGGAEGRGCAEGEDHEHQREATGLVGNAGMLW